MLTEKEIFNNTEEYIKWMCFDIFISIDNQVFTLSGKKLKEQLRGGSYCFFCNGQYRTKTWIRNHCTNVHGLIVD